MCHLSLRVLSGDDDITALSLILTVKADSQGRQSRQTVKADSQDRPSWQTVKADIQGRHSRQTVKTDRELRQVDKVSGLD
jgi:hypothetical protein